MKIKKASEAELESKNRRKRRAEVTEKKKEINKIVKDGGGCSGGNEFVGVGGGVIK